MDRKDRKKRSPAAMAEWKFFPRPEGTTAVTPLLDIVRFEPDPDARGPRWKGHMVVDHEGTRMRLPFWALPERNEEKDIRMRPA